MKSKHFQKSRYSWLIDIIFLGFVLSIFYLAFIGARPLLVPDEARYAEVAREMALNNNFLIPYLNGVIYFEKPILLYWLTAAAIKINGVSITSVRLVNVILAVFGCLLTYGVASRLYGRLAGFFAAFMLATSALYYFMAHIVNMDLTVTVFMMGCLYAMVLGVDQPMGLSRRLLMYAAFTSAALAVLAKGLIGIVLPTVIVTLWLFILDDLRAYKTMYLPTSIILFLLIAAPWHILVEMHYHDFFQYYFVYQHLLRYLTPVAQHVEPITFFVPVLIVGFFPWIAFLPQAITDGLPPTWKQRHKYKHEIFFLLWAAIIFLFFSFSQCKLISYVLPVIPPMAVLTARYMSLQVDKSLPIGIRIGFGFLLVLSMITGAAYIWLTYFYQIPNPTCAHIYLYPAAWLIFFGSVMAVLFEWRQQTLYAIAVMIISSAGFLVLTQKAVEYIDSRTILPLVNVIEPILKPNDEVVAFDKYYFDLPFYLQRRVIVAYHMDEFDYGNSHQDTSEWMIDKSTFWSRWHSLSRLYVLMNTKDYGVLVRDNPTETFYILGTTQHDILVTNHPIHVITQSQSAS